MSCPKWFKLRHAYANIHQGVWINDYFQVCIPHRLAIGLSPLQMLQKRHSWHGTERKYPAFLKDVKQPSQSVHRLLESS